MLRRFPSARTCLHHPAVCGMILVLLTGLVLMPNAKLAAKSSQQDASPYFSEKGTTRQQVGSLKDPSVYLDDDNWSNYRVRKGDNLFRILSWAGADTKNANAMIRTDGADRVLRSLKPGDNIGLQSDAKGRLTQLKLTRDNEEILRIYQAPDQENYILEWATENTSLKTRYVEGRISENLYLAARKAGLSGELIMALTDIFSSRIDFSREVQKGDTFRVLYQVLDSGEAGQILAAEFINKGTTFLGLRYTSETGATSYYTPEGKSLGTAFLRYPLDKARISSHYGFRNHPILKTRKFHAGTDFAAKRGTPVKATSAGKIKKAGRNGGYGKSVVISHGKGYSTRYAHLHTIPGHIKPGARVEQGDIIGHVGSTGRSTGPHLHYEIAVNGKTKNPMKVALPTAPPIPNGEKAQFLLRTQPILAQMEDRKAAFRVASNSR